MLLFNILIYIFSFMAILFKKKKGGSNQSKGLQPEPEPEPEPSSLFLLTEILSEALVSFSHWLDCTIKE